MLRLFLLLRFAGGLAQCLNNGGQQWLRFTPLKLRSSAATTMQLLGLQPMHGWTAWLGQGRSVCCARASGGGSRVLLQLMACRHPNASGEALNAERQALPAMRGG